MHPSPAVPFVTPMPYPKGVQPKVTGEPYFRFKVSRLYFLATLENPLFTPYFTPFGGTGTYRRGTKETYLMAKQRNQRFLP